MKIEAAFSASIRNTNPHNSGIKRLLLYCFITQREAFNCYSLYIWPVFNDFVQSSSRSTVLVTCAMAQILSGIHRNPNKGNVVNIFLMHQQKQIGKSIAVTLSDISLN